MPDRTAEITRKTNETDVRGSVNLDGTGRADVQTGVGFFDHMLDLFARHSRIDLTVRADGDLHVDAHHTVEDVGIVLGQALRQALGDKRGITRYGSAAVPMDATLCQVAVDLSGRSAYVSHIRFRGHTIGTFDVELVDEFFKSVAANALMALHIAVPYGDNDHHAAEAVFKAVARSVRQAVEYDPRNAEVPSTKGSL